MPRGSNPNSKANLKRGNPATQFKPGRKQSELAKKGAKAANEKQKAQKEFRELFRLALTQPVAKDKDGNDITAKEGIVTRVIKMALDGNMRAVDEVIDLIGERPKETDTGEFDKLDEILNKIEGKI